MSERVFNYTFAGIYQLYVAKVERKGRTVVELDEVLCWLTGFSAAELQQQIDSGSTLRELFADAPMNPNTGLITGVVCGVRVEDIEEPLMQRVRWLDKLVDELAKGKALEKVLRG